MRRRWWVLGAVVLAAGVAAPFVRDWYLRPSPRLGPLDAVPAAERLSVRVGERVRFSGSAAGATGFTWLVWGRPVSFDPSWSYVPAPEDAGWQQVTLEVTGRSGERLARTWDVGVVPAVAPEIESLEPAAGPLALPAGEHATFRARAHLPASRASDRLAFEWLLDDRPVLREERQADDATSELLLPPSGAGAHRLRLRVTEDGRSASIADWTLEVVTGRAVAQPRVPAPNEEHPTPPATVTPEAPALAAVPRSAPALVRMPGPRELETRVGEALPLEARVEPPAEEVSYRWTVDGKPVAARGARLEFTPTTPGWHRVGVTIAAGKRTIGRDSWVVTARGSPPAAPAAGTPGLPSEPAPRIARLPAVDEIEAPAGGALAFEIRVDPAPASVVYRWTVDGRPVPRQRTRLFEYEPDDGGPHRVVVSIEADGKTLGRESWVIAARARDAAAAPVAAVLEPAPAVALAAPPQSATALAEADVRRWLEDYARAWSRKDIGALRRMGQVRSTAEAAQLERYFGSIDSLAVQVRVIGLTVKGERASVEFERTDTVTDPSGRRQQLRLPPIRKEIERTPEGLRFAAESGAG